MPFFFVVNLYSKKSSPPGHANWIAVYAIAPPPSSPRSMLEVLDPPPPSEAAAADDANERAALDAARTKSSKRKSGFAEKKAQLSFY